MNIENKILEILDLVREKVLSPDEALPHIMSLFNNNTQNKNYHCELFDFGRKNKPCEKQCSGCKAMNLDY